MLDDEGHLCGRTTQQQMVLEAAAGEAFTNVIAVACLAWALLLFGRSKSETHEEES